MVAELGELLHAPSTVAECAPQMSDEQLADWIAETKQRLADLPKASSAAR